MSSIFNLPDVGEGLTEAEILAWKVGPGSTVAVNDVLVEIETAKSVVELPSPFEGTVEQLLAEEGATVEVGQPLISVAVAGEASGAPEDSPAGEEGAPPEASRPAAEGAAPEISTPAPEEPAGQTARSGSEGGSETAALVGSGPKADPVKRRARRRTTSSPAAAAPPASQPAASAEAAPAGLAGRLGGAGLGATLAERARRLAEGGRDALNRLPGRAAEEPMPTASAHRTVPSEPPRRPALAKPPVRKAAKEMGVDLAHVPATGAQGQVTHRDLLNYTAHSQDLGEAKPGDFWVPASQQAGDRIERIPVKGVRKATAKAVTKSAFEAPHVSIFVDVDASRTMEFVKRLKASPSFEGVKVTPLLILAKAVIWATARNPQVNSAWTESEILIKRYINLGIAAATPRGLLVPNIKDAQDLSLKELAIALDSLTKIAREGKTQPADMTGGTMTVTNIGALGIDTGTPIINAGEAAIIAFGTIKQKPWVVDGEVIPRWVTTLGGSFDHRILDGDLSARFMADVAAVMEEPALLLDM
jgi:2-oxoisovalerate dehydrogenase E2 component (dihydrolipoyl transacylase)